MKVTNMTSYNGNKIANQFIIYDDNNNKYFQSYHSTIVKIENWDVTEGSRINYQRSKKVYLDKRFWDCSHTTSKYRNIFLEESRKETEKKIKDGTYILTDLNVGLM
jgi:hypothetical protein|tara:strand:- start:274 stop:591 length:318 start_codon:yes stop_codon:yes gene_type:complete